MIKIRIKTLKTLLHVSIIRSSSGSILCSLLKLRFKTLSDFLIKTDQLDVTCFIISLFNAQHVSDVNTTILRSQELATYLLSYFMGCIALVRCVLVLRCDLAGVVWYPYAG